nr:uncharacterized protein LOC105609854 isoform X1 [Ovis aries]
MPRARSAHPSGLWPPDLPPPVPWPPAGPRRRLPYLRSPGPPFYFLKPSHKAPRRPGLVCFLPETPARAHSPNRLRARWAASACARSPARRRAPDRSQVQAKLVARACALTAPASFSRRPRGRGQGRAGRVRRAGQGARAVSLERAAGNRIRSSSQLPGRSGFSCPCFPIVFRLCPPRLERGQWRAPQQRPFSRICPDKNEDFYMRALLQRNGTLLFPAAHDSQVTETFPGMVKAKSSYRAVVP